MPANARQIVPFPTPKTISNPKPKKKAANKKRVWLRLGLLLFAVTYLSWAGTQLLRQESRMEQLSVRYEQLLAEQKRLEMRNVELEKQIDSLLHDPAYLEQLAREMGMVKPGDTIYLPVAPSGDR